MHRTFLIFSCTFVFNCNQLLRACSLCEVQSIHDFSFFNPISICFYHVSAHQIPINSSQPKSLVWFENGVLTVVLYWADFFLIESSPRLQHLRSNVHLTIHIDQSKIDEVQMSDLKENEMSFKPSWRLFLENLCMACNHESFGISLSHFE